MVNVIIRDDSILRNILDKQSYYLKIRTRFLFFLMCILIFLILL